MSMPMICCAAIRASSGVCASLMPPALPRPPTGTCDFTATGPSLAQAAAASSEVRATAPGGIEMPTEERTSFAWYSRSFTLLRGLEGAGRLRVLRVVVPRAANALAERGAVDQDDSADHEHYDDDQRESAADQDRGQRGHAAARGRLPGRPPHRSIPVLQAVIGDPCSIRVLSRHLERSLLAERDTPVVAPHPVALRILKRDLGAKLEACLPADGVRRSVLDRGKGVDEAAPLQSPGELDCLYHRGRRDPPTLELRQNAPAHLVDVLALPFALPEVHPSH